MSDWSSMVGPVWLVQYDYIYYHSGQVKTNLKLAVQIIYFCIDLQILAEYIGIMHAL